MVLSFLHPSLLVAVHCLVGVEEGDVAARGGPHVGLYTGLMDVEETLQQLLPSRQLPLVSLLLPNAGPFYLRGLSQQHVGYLFKIDKMQHVKVRDSSKLFFLQSKNLEINYHINGCLLYTSDAADDMQCVDLGGRRIIKK